MLESSNRKTKQSPPSSANKSFWNAVKALPCPSNPLI